MSGLSQPDLHPDADSLSAFAERALPEGESARIVAHMAGCARCREVVFLAQAAAEPETAKVEGDGGARRGGFVTGMARWRLAWIPAAALAAIGGVVLWVQVRPAPESNTMARNVVPPAPAVAAQPVADATAQTMVRAPQTVVRPEAKKAKPGVARPVEERNEAGLKPAAPAARGGQEGREAGGGDRAAGPSSFALASRTTAQEALLAPRPSPAAPPAPEPADARWHGAGKPEQMRIPASGETPTAPPAPEPPHMVAVQGMALGEPELAAGRGTPPPAFSPQSMNGLAVLRLAKRTRLPSGLNAVSSAALLDRLLALDSAGSVFLSRDGGRHWEAVRAQWTGKAIDVQAPPGRMFAHPGAESRRLMNARAAAPVSQQGEEARAVAPPPQPAETASVEVGLPPPAMLFKLVTDQRQTWVSADGKIWHKP